MEVVCFLLTAYLVVIFLRIVLSWFPISRGSAMETVASFLWAATEPVLGPLRRVIPPVRLGTMGLDISPIVVVLGISILRGIICG